jgi:magnesium transporter
MTGAGARVADDIVEGTDPDAVKWFSRRIKDGDREAVLERIGAWNPSQVFTLMRELPLNRARTLFGWIPLTRAVGILDIVDPRAGVILAADETLDRLVEILQGLGLDEAVDIVGLLPDDTRERVIDRVPAGTELAARVSYGIDTAGEIMTDEFVAVPGSRTLLEVVTTIQDRAAEVGTVRAVYVTGSDGALVGYLEPEDLLVHPGNDPISVWARSDILTVSPDIDQEDVLRLARDQHVTTIPVVDSGGRLLGGITTEELGAVLQEELREDGHIASGLDPDATPNDSVWQMVTHRLPWLLAGLIGSALAGVTIGRFEDQLLEAAILASFIPVVMAMAGNAGIQASQVTVAGMSNGTIWQGDQLRRFGRETAGALINSAVVGLAMAGFVLVADWLGADIDDAVGLAVTAVIALMASMTMAVALGATLPIGLDRAGVDPAVATGVFIAAANDIIGVSVFFAIASVLYL